MIKKILLLFFLISTMCFSSPITTTYSTIDYALSNTTTAPGDDNYIVFNLTHLPKWHSYWKNPGESGLKTSISWNLPEGISSSEIYWPAPDIFLYGPLINFGYKNTVNLIVKLSSNSTVKPGSYPLNATISWLVCKDSCIPESAEFDINFEISDTTTNSTYHDSIHTQLKNITFEDLRLPYIKTKEYIEFNLPFNKDIDLNSLYFFPSQLNSVDIKSKLDVKLEDNQIQIRLIMLENPENNISGLLRLNKDSYINLTLTNTPSSAKAVMILQMALFAFLGGLILNIMPCVFPILSLKVLNILDKSKTELSLIRKQAWAYSIGVIVSFLIIVACLIWLKSIGLYIGWGFQLQNPLFVFSLFLIFILVGFNLNSFLDTPPILLKTSGSVSNLYNKLTTTGIFKDFFTGVLAVIVATPCTAPLMAPAIGFALTQSIFVTFIIFLMLGLGFCFPFLIIAYVPFLQKLLPKPGNWMIKLKHILALFLYASALWLLSILAVQLGQNIWIFGISLSVILLIFLIISKKTNLKSILKNSLFVFILILSIYIFQIMFITKTQNLSTSSQTLSKINNLVDNNNSVLVDVTAAWCITCKVNETLVLNTKEIKTFLEKNNITLIKLDWTNYDDSITNYLESFNRQGVPLYVYYHKNGKITLLPQLLNKQDIYNLKELK